jgi:DNA-binding response OmpR family regulator
MSKILIVENDAEVLGAIELMIQREGYEVWTARSAQAALNYIEEETPDLCVINAVLPGIDGVALCRKLRSHTNTASISIMVLNDNDSPYTIADVLNAGGDDSMRKPFAQRELAARIRAQLRRQGHSSSSGEMPVLRLNSATSAVFVNEREVMLTQVEFDLLNYLCSAPNIMHTTSDLLTFVWQYPRGTGDAALVRNHVRNLRRKLEDDPERPAIIQSRHGRGYVVRAKVEGQEKLVHGLV